MKSRRRRSARQVTYRKVEIASYGHVSTRPVDQIIGIGGTGARACAGGVQAALMRVHGSFFMEMDGGHARVLDEAPPTDFESDIFEGRSTESMAHAQHLHLFLTSILVSYPTPRGRRSPLGSLCWPPQSPSHQRRPPASSVRTSSCHCATDAEEAREESCCHCSIAINEKSRSRAPLVSQPRSKRDGSHRRSVGEYPVPVDEDMADAIPTWTQPVPPGSSWDDVHISFSG